MLDEIIKVLPCSISKEILNIGAREGITEIRLRAGKRGIVIASKTEILLSCVITIKDLLDILVNISRNSIYAIQNDIKSGFVVIKGGHRVGI